MIPFFKHEVSKTAEFFCLLNSTHHQKTPGVWFHPSIYSTCYISDLLLNGPRNPVGFIYNLSVFKSVAPFVQIFICFLAVSTLNGTFIVQVSLEKLAGRRHNPCEETCQLWCPLAVAVLLFAESPKYICFMVNI